MTHESDRIPSSDDIETVVAAFQGTIEQIPPMFSAKKIDGVRLYKSARNGTEVERKPQQVNVSVKIVDYTYPEVKLNVTCSKGTYIRSLAHDIGCKLGCYAHLIALNRTRSGPFLIKDCIDPRSLSD